MNLRNNLKILIMLLSAIGLIMTSSPVHAKKTGKKTASCAPVHVRQKVKQPASGKGRDTPAVVDKKLTTLIELQVHDASLLAELERNELKK